MRCRSRRRSSRSWRRGCRRRIATSTIRLVADQLRSRVRIDARLEPVPLASGNPSAVAVSLLGILVAMAEHITPGPDAVVTLRTFPNGGIVVVEVAEPGGAQPRDSTSLAPGHNDAPHAISHARHLIETAGGRLEIEESDGRARIRIVLPMAASTSRPERPTVKDTRVLVVDDDPTIRRRSSSGCWRNTPD